MNVLFDDIRLNYNLPQRDLLEHSILISTRNMSKDDKYTAGKRKIQALPISKTVSWELFDERGRSLLDFCWYAVYQQRPLKT